MTVTCPEPTTRAEMVARVTAAKRRMLEAGLKHQRQAKTSAVVPVAARRVLTASPELPPVVAHRPAKLVVVTPNPIMTLVDCDLAEAEIPPAQPFMADVLLAVSRATGISVVELRSHRRYHNMARARTVFYYLCREICATSYPAIGRVCGDRDHSTVMNGIRNVQSARPAYEAVLYVARQELRYIMAWKAGLNA